MRDITSEIEAAGAQLVVIGNGKPHQAARFRDAQGIDFQLLVDPEMKAYRAAGLRRDVGSMLSPRTVTNGLRAFMGGHRQKRLQGDPWQQGGAFVIAAGGELLFSQISQATGDHVDPDDLLETLRLDRAS